MSYLFPTYARWEVEPDTAIGTLLTDKNGKTYLDFTSGIGVCNLGHQPEAVKEAVKTQLDRFWHVSNLFTMNEQEKAAERLAKAAGMDAVFFSNSGAEANEGAIKLARKATGRNKIITFTQSFHGRTFATMAATGQDKVKQGFGSMLETFEYVPFNDLDSLKQAMGSDVAAVMLEVIQGEGGIHIGTTEFLQGAEQLCREYGSLLIIDEIQTGIGRTGKPFAFQHFDLDPDIVTSAKGLGSGFPIGAVIGKESLNEFFGPGSHGSTFGGNPLSVTAASATMDEIFQEAFLQEVLNKSEYVLNQLKTALSDLELLVEIRGLGLMIGIELTVPVGDILTELRAQGVIALSAGEKVLRLLPPLTVTEDELKQGAEKINEVVRNFCGTAL
ncbi:acetylornithine transaminase [Bacillus dakarensis]|uniref:acetylornithine transaminase n=1 Tax=Robertmurraya dakarensis TaxID=1926278 RepID=UPI000980C597|nr:acetylornithine transaminase [Bacillus dakarensis]